MGGGIGNVCITFPLVVVLPVVCDTFHASADVALSGWLLTALADAQNVKEGLPLVWDQNGGGLALYDPEAAPASGWTLRRGNLGVYGGAYQFTAQGRGLWSGIMLAIGQPRADDADPATMRRVRVMLGSELLWRHAVKGSTAYDAMRGVLDALAIAGADDANPLATAPADDEVKPSRIDVCRDHFGYEWKRADLDGFACRQRNRGGVESYKPEARFWERPDQVSTYHGATTATYYVGKRGARARFLRVYDKTEEAAVSGKLPWLEPLWAAYGWTPGTKVWRAEVEHGSEWLAEHGCRTLNDVIGFEYAAWRRYVRDVRHTLGNKDRGDDMRRCESSRVWLALSTIDETAEPSPWVWSSRRPSLGADKAALAKQAAGCAAKLAPLFEIAGAEDHPVYKGLPAGASTPAEIRQHVIDHLEPLIREAQERQARAAINALTDAYIEKATRHIPKERDHG